MPQHDHRLNFDFLALEDNFTSAQLELKARVRHFVDTELMPLVEDSYESESFPRDVVAKFAKEGLLGLHLKGYGLPGFDPIQYGLVMKEVERCDSGFRSFLSVHCALAMYAIHQFGSEEQKKFWLPRMGAGESIGAFALTEPQGGSDPASMRTEAVLHQGTWLINGHW